MDTGIEDTLRKLAAHTKLVCVVSMLQGRNAIQRDIDRFERLVCANLMKSSKAKCKVLHLDHGNPMLKPINVNSVYIYSYLRLKT